MREFDLPERQEKDPAPDRLAARLDELQMDAVERVLRRAIELQSASDDRTDAFDGDTVKKIARELGIDTQNVEQALFEERIGDRVDTLTLLDRMFAPPRLSGRTTVDGPRPDVDAAADAWLGRHEGLRKRREIPDGALWERDPSAITKIRMGLKLGRGTGALRSAGGVVHRVHTAPSGEHVVGIDIDTRVIGRTARALLAAGTAIGLLLGVALAIGPGVVEAVAAGVGSVVAFGAAAFATARTWTSRIRRGIRRALDAIASPAAAGVHDTVADRVGKSLRAWSELGRDLKKKL